MVPLIGDNHSLGDPVKSLRRGNKKTFVRPDQIGPLPRPQRERPPLRANPRIYDREVDSIVGHVAGGVLQDLRPNLYLEPCHLMCQVHEHNPRRDACHYPLARTDEVLGNPEVREETYGPHASSINRAVARATLCAAVPDAFRCGRPKARQTPPSGPTISSPHSSVYLKLVLS